MRAWIGDLLVVGWMGAAVGCQEPPVVVGEADDIVEPDDEDVVDDDAHEATPDVPEPVDTSCTEHAQCESGACDLVDGECFAVEDVRIVDETTCDADDAVHCTVSNALSTIVERGAVRVRGDGSVGPVSVEDKRVAIVVERGYTASANVVTAHDAEVMLEGLDLLQPVLECDASSLYLDRVRIEGAIPADGCYVRMRRSTWDQTLIDLPFDSIFSIENSFVHLLFGLVGEGTTYTLDFTTVWTEYELGACFAPPSAIAARGSLLVSTQSDWPDPANCGIATAFHGNAGTALLFDGPDGNQKLGKAENLPLVAPPLDLHIYKADPFFTPVDDLTPPDRDIDGDERDPYRVIIGADAI